MPAAALPPSFRDFEVFHLIRVESKSTREAAAETGVSQTRVRQIVEKVAAFLLEVVPEGAEAMLSRRLEVAKFLAAERLDAIYGHAMESWRKSQGEQTTTRHVKTGTPGLTQSTASKQSHGDSKYLRDAAKFAQAAGKMPANSLFSLAPAEADTPEEDCSPAAAKSPVSKPAAASNVAASLPEAFTSVLDAGREFRQTWDATRPAQPDKTSPAVSARDRQKRQAFLSDAG